MRRLLRGRRAKALPALLGLALLVTCGAAKASFVDDETELRQAISELRSAIGGKPRALKIEVDARAVAIEAQDPRNPTHVDRWRYEERNLLGLIPMRRLAGPAAVDLQLLDPDLEANLFDLDAVDFAATARLERAALEHARMQDAAVVTHMEIARQVSILPRPISGDIRWTLHLASGREHADVFANAQGAIVGADLGGTQRAKTLNLFGEPGLLVEAAAAFRAAIGSGPVLTSVGIGANTVSFGTNIPDTAFGKIIPGMPATASFTWNLGGLSRRLGAIDVNAQMGTQGPASFSIDDVDWTIIARLEASALAKVETAKPRISRIGIEKSSARPGAPVLAWTVEITEPDGEITSVIAASDGAIERVVLPPSRRPKIDWRDPAALAGAMSRIGAIFGAKASIASIVVDERGGRMTVDDPSNGGRPATYELSADGLTRAAISFSLESMGPRFGIGDLASLTEQRIAALEADALKRLGERKPVYLESLSIGPQLFVPKAGARAIEVRVRDAAVDSASANYAWIVYDFDGRMLDFVTP